YFRSMNPTIGLNPKVVEANFSPLHGCNFVYSLDLSLETRREGARLLLNYPDTITSDILIQFAVSRLAENSWPSTALYYLSLPLGKLYCWALSLQDTVEALRFLYEKRHSLPMVASHPSSPDWPELYLQGEETARRNANGNPYGIDNKVW